MGDRVAVMRGGKLQQVSSPEDLYDHPANIFVAGFIGSPAMNIFRSRLSKDERGNLTIDFGGKPLQLGAGTLQRYPQLEQDSPQEELMLVGLRPEAFSVAQTDAKNSISVEVKTIEALGHEMIIYAVAPIDKIDTDEDRSGELARNTDRQNSSILTARVASSRTIQVGHQLTLSVDLDRLYLFAIDGERIQ